MRHVQKPSPQQRIFIMSLTISVSKHSQSLNVYIWNFRWVLKATNEKLISTVTLRNDISHTQKSKRIKHTVNRALIVLMLNKAKGEVLLVCLTWIRALFLIWLYRVLTCGAKYMSNSRLSCRKHHSHTLNHIHHTATSSEFPSNLHFVQQFETRRILGLVELEDNITDLRFQL